MDKSGKIRIKLQGGEIEAARDNDIFKARGIRYASANRFELPHPAQPWEGVLDCTHPASICPQMVPSRLDSVTGPITSGRVQDEDCLHLTVTASVEALTGGKKRPVMVFLHGGAYVSGGGDLDAYSPVGLAQRGLVMVNITHRLGLFGYLPIHDRAPANLGLYDQIMALEWIQGNIADFGGDPNRVTLFGESAGADSIFCLMIAEGTRHLFHQAILQSAPLGVRMMDREQMIQALGALAHHRLASSEAPRTSDEMLSLQVELLMEAKKHPSGLMAFGPSLGHAPLPPLSEVSHKVQLAAKQINLFVGYTTHEGAPFARMNDTLRSYFDLPLIGWLIERLMVWIVSRKMFICGIAQLHSRYLRAGGSSRKYRFDWWPSQSDLRSTHCLELPFLLGTWTDWAKAPMLHGPESRVVLESLGTKMKDLWAAFAKGLMKLENVNIVGDETYGEIIS